jgi:thiamine biosynthesis lipoprotein
MAAERQARLMGTDVSVIVVGDPALAERGIRRLADLETRWSRFTDDSDVSRINRFAGAPVEVSADTVLLVRRAIDAWRLSAGFVDCTELHQLIAAGYDRSFELLPLDRPAPADGAGPLQLAGPADIAVVGSTVAIPATAGFDPGGIGKGLAADLVSAELLAAGADGVCVNVGGDLRVRGAGPDGAGWTVAIEHPHHDRPLVLVGVTDGAVATSTTLRRTWCVDGRRMHHIIDPRTGRPSESGVELASVIAAEGWQAEALAKAVLIRGGPHPFDLVDGSGAAALVVAETGAVEVSSGFGRFCGDALPPSEVPHPEREELLR